MVEISELTLLNDQQGLIDSLRTLSGDDTESDDEDRVLSFRMKRAIGAEVTMFVAREGGIIVGTASVIIEPKLIHGGSYAGHLEDVSVAETHWRKGVASSLIERVIAYCREKGCYKITLDCDAVYAPLYEKLGFRYDCLAMRMDLSCDAP